MAKKRTKTQSYADELINQLIDARETTYEVAEQSMDDFRKFFTGTGRRRKLEHKTVDSILNAFSVPDKECKTKFGDKNQLWHADGRVDFLEWFCKRFQNQVQALKPEHILIYVEERIIPNTFLDLDGVSSEKECNSGEKLEAQATVANGKDIKKPGGVDVFLDAFKGPLPDFFDSQKVLCLSSFSGIEPVEFSMMEPEKYKDWSLGVETIADKITEKHPKETRVCGYCPLYVFYLLGQKLEFSTSGLVFCNPQRLNDPEKGFQLFRIDEETEEEGIEFIISHRRTESKAGDIVVVQIFMDPNLKGKTNSLLKDVKKDGHNVFNVIQILPVGKEKIDVTKENFSRFLKGMKETILKLAKRLKRESEKKVALSIYGAGFLAFLVGLLLRRNVTNTVFFYEYFHKGDRYICVNPVKGIESTTAEIPTEINKIEKCISLLHISDFHVDAEKEQTVNAMKRYLTELGTRIRKEDIELDFIMVTGDLVFKPTEGNFKSFEEIFMKFVSTLWEREKKDRKFVIFVPGNHDVEWGENEKSFSENIESRAHKHRFELFTESMTRLLETLKECGIEMMWSTESKLHSISRDFTLPIQIQLLNTAYTYHYQNRESMKVNPEGLGENKWGSLENQDPQEVRIVLTHHPISCLHPDDRGRDGVAELILLDSHFHLFGHTHQGMMMFYGGHVQLGMGAVYHRDNEPITSHECCVIQIARVGSSYEWKPIFFQRLLHQGLQVTNQDIWMPLKLRF